MRGVGGKNVRSEGTHVFGSVTRLVMSILSSRSAFSMRRRMMLTCSTAVNGVLGPAVYALPLVRALIVRFVKDVLAHRLDRPDTMRTSSRTL
jgi:hypothetical protein